MSDVLFYSLLVVVILVGIAVGSFLNVVIYRLPLGMNLAKPASHCPTCGEKIKWYDNIPILSYIFLRGKCRHCHTHISFRYTLVELLNPLLWVAAYLLFVKTDWVYVVIVGVACSLLIAMAFIDIEHQEVPEVLLWLLLIDGMCSFFCLNAGDPLMRVYGFLLGGGFLLLIGGIVSLFKKKKAVGSGDIILMAFGGLIGGLWSTVIAYFVGSVVAAIVLVIIAIVRKADKNVTYPFIPFLAIGLVFAYIVGPFIVEWYGSLLA